MTPEDIEGLDPGVRQLVVRLNEAGFETCDSGDGYTKFLDPRNHTEFVLKYPHVFIRVHRADLFATVDRVEAYLRTQGVVFDRTSLSEGQPSVVGHVEPNDLWCFVEVANVTDDILKKEADDEE